MAKKPLDDQFDREVFYRGSDPEAEEVEDYELLPPDEEVVAGEKRRAAEVLETAGQAVDVDELYREPEPMDREDIEEYFKDFRLRFTTKHLLIAMTALAVAFTVGRFLLDGWFSLLLVLTFLTLASAYAFFTWQEHQQRQEWERKRDELYQRNKQRHRKRDESASDAQDNCSPNKPRVASNIESGGRHQASAIFVQRAWFTYSIQDLLALATALSLVLVAAIHLGIGGASIVTGALLGVAVVLQIFLADPPRLLASIAWMLLAFYLALSCLSLGMGSGL